MASQLINTDGLEYLQTISTTTYCSVIGICPHCEEPYVKNYDEKDRQWCGYYINDECIRYIAEYLSNSSTVWYELATLLDISQCEIFNLFNAPDKEMEAFTMLSIYISGYKKEQNESDSFTLGKMWSTVLKALNGMLLWSKNKTQCSNLIYHTLLPILCSNHVQDSEFVDARLHEIALCIADEWEEFCTKHLNMSKQDLNKVRCMTAFKNSTRQCSYFTQVSNNYLQVFKVLKLYVETKTCPADRLVHIFKFHLKFPELVSYLHKYGVQCIDSHCKLDSGTSKM